MRIDVAIIGGTGVGERLLALGGEDFSISTPFGALNGSVLGYNGTSILLVSRHSAGHKVPPHKVNYRAIASGLKSLGVAGCFASAAVGSLRRDWGPGTMVACSDFLDFSGRNLTLFDEAVVHTDFTHPFGASTRQNLIASAAAQRVPLETAGVYICANGPRYETPKEVQLYKSFGGDVVGMTAASEAILMREAGLDYATLAVVTNLAAGISDQPLSHDEVVEQMVKSGEVAVSLLLDAARRQAA